MNNYCKCGCGNKTSIITKTNIKQGRIKGNYNIFIAGHNRQFKKGKLNPQYGIENKWGNHSEETKLKISNNKERAKKISLAKKGIKTERVPKTAFKKGHKVWNIGIPCSKETKIKISQKNKGNRNSIKTEFKKGHNLTKTGKDHQWYIHGEGYDKYSKDFLKKRDSIRKRDNYRCQECFRHQNELQRKLSIHHIDFNKNNNSNKNLISLCNSCHMQTMFNRDEWIKYYKERMIESGNC